MARHKKFVHRQDFRYMMHNHFKITDDVILDKSKQYRTKLKTYFYINLSITRDVRTFQSTLLHPIFAVFRVFNVSQDNKLSEREFVEGMSLYLRGTNVQQIRC